MNASLPRPNAPPKKKHFLLALTSGAMTVPAPAPPAGWRPHNTTQFNSEGKKQTGGVHHRSKVLIKNNHKETFIESFFQNECEKQDAEMWSFPLNCH